MPQLLSLFRPALIAHPESVRRLQRLPRILVVCAAISLGGTGYSAWNAQARLVAARATVRSLQSKTAQTSRALHDKRERALQAASLQTQDPLGRGSMELTAEFSRLARAAGVQIGMFHIAPVGAAPAATGPNPPAANTASGKGAAPAVGASVSVRNDRWTQALFDYEFTGAFPALNELLHRLAESPRIVEITSLEMARAQTAGPSGKVMVRLRLSGIVYGLPKSG